MAVFPSARRVLARPLRLPWSVGAVALLALTLSIPAYSLLDDEAARSSQTVMPAPSHAAETAPDGQPAPDSALASSLVDDVVVLDPPAVDHPAGAGTTAPVSELGSAVRSNGSQTLDTVRETAAAPALDAQTGASSEPGTVPSNAAAIARWAQAGVVIETEGQHLDVASLANVDAALSALPAHVLGQLGNPALGPLHILVNMDGRVLSGNQPYGGPANFFSTNDARNELVLYPQQSVFTIVHELGHAYNLRRMDPGRYAMVLLEPEMRSFLADAGWNISSSEAEILAAVDHMHVGYSYSGSFHWPRLSNDDPLEDFANSFATYFLEPQTLLQVSPERYAWMAETFGQ